LDLTDEQYAGQVALAPTNASFQDFVTVLRVQLGEDEAQAWLDGMAAGDPPTFDGNTAIVEAVGRGEVPMGLVNHYYAARALAEDPDLPVANHFFPEGDYGSTLLVTAGAIIEGTDDADAAAQLLDFLLSEEAQTYFSQETFEYPLASGVEPPEGVPPFHEVPNTRVDLSELDGGPPATPEMIDARRLTRWGPRRPSARRARRHRRRRRRGVHGTPALPGMADGHRRGGPRRPLRLAGHARAPAELPGAGDGDGPVRRRRRHRAGVADDPHRPAAAPALGDAGGAAAGVPLVRRCPGAHRRARARWAAGGAAGARRCR